MHTDEHIPAQPEPKCQRQQQPYERQPENLRPGREGRPRWERRQPGTEHGQSRCVFRQWCRAPGSHGSSCRMLAGIAPLPRSAPVGRCASCRAVPECHVPLGRRRCRTLSGIARGRSVVGAGFKPAHTQGTRETGRPGASHVGRLLPSLAELQRISRCCRVVVQIGTRLPWISVLLPRRVSKFFPEVFGAGARFNPGGRRPTGLNRLSRQRPCEVARKGTEPRQRNAGTFLHLACPRPENFFGSGFAWMGVSVCIDG